MCVCVRLCVCVCVCFVYLHHFCQHCVSQVEIPLIANNKVSNFWKEKALWRINFWYQWIIHSMQYRYLLSAHKRLCYHIFIWVCQSIGPWVCCVCLCFCVISNQCTSKKHVMCQTSVNLTPCCKKHTASSYWYQVPRLRMCRFISLSKITHQMWGNHPFSQKNKTRKSAGGVEVGGNGEDRHGKGVANI